MAPPVTLLYDSQNFAEHERDFDINTYDSAPLDWVSLVVIQGKLGANT